MNKISTSGQIVTQEKLVICTPEDSAACSQCKEKSINRVRLSPLKTEGHLKDQYTSTVDLYLDNKGCWQKHSVGQGWSPAEISQAGRKSVPVNA